MGDFDGTIGAAWTEYRAKLADRLTRLAPSASLIAEQNSSIPEGAHGLVEFTVTDDDRIPSSYFEAADGTEPWCLTASAALAATGGDEQGSQRPLD
ncbi:TY-Chap domain-containing protein [Gordonia sp. NPDC003429]